MNRTRVLFLAIVGIALLIVIAAAITRNNGGAGPGTATATAAPLPKGTVKVTLASSNTKKVWLDQVVKGFNAARQKTAAGNAIVVEVSHVTSGASLNAILGGTLQPVAWSPGDPSWVEQANTAWAREHGNRPLASDTCPATIFAPLGFAMWRPMAEALGWPDKPIGWDTMVALAADPDGWASRGRPEWGRFTFGHTHPAYANSGLLSMTTFVYGIAGKQDTLTVADVYA
ncbi:MAG: VWA domain-containing protein, partial [Anaerolineae bacterium]